MEDAEGILLSSFLAGALLKNSTITYIELTNYISQFEDDTNYIIDDGLDKLSDIVYNGDCLIGLKKDYNDLYNNGCTIKGHLYSMTNSEVRKFFEIEEIQMENKNDSPGKKPGILSKIKTRVFLR